MTLRKHELLLNGLKGEIVDVPSHFLEGFTGTWVLPAGDCGAVDQVIVRKKDALVEMILNEMKRCHTVQVPAENSEKIELTALDSMEAGVRAAMSEVGSMAVGEEEATVEAISHEAVAFA